jgi:hypothetical protein
MLSVRFDWMLHDFSELLLSSCSFIWWLTKQLIWVPLLYLQYGIKTKRKKKKRMKAATT